MATCKPGEVANPNDYHGRSPVKGTLLNGGSDTKEYNVWFRNDPNGGNAEKYLVDDSGKPVYYVDPGINGTIRKLPNGQDIPKFDAPKATLMSYIIKGILGATAAVGPRAPRRDDRDRARDVRHSVARVRGRRLSSALLLLADSRRRDGALGGGHAGSRRSTRARI